MGHQLDLSWPDLVDKRVLGFGYALPYLSTLHMRAQQCLAFMPASQGAVPWPCADKVATALVFEEDLPLPDASIDCVLLIHALEYTENARETLNEIWRILVPNGHLILIVPNRSGFWACNDRTPFGYGQPYTRQQVIHLFQETNFAVGPIHDVVHYMPSSGYVQRFISLCYESFARYLFPYLGGLLVCHAQKRVYQGLLVQRRQSRRVFIPTLSPQIRKKCDETLFSLLPEGKKK
ncbi:SAM-dependent methyltransferase 2, in cluster with Hydroxyacylglutathione hydrolase [Bartonella ancashensis]|uniref:SAM-dependent methyltransferase 2, in cluster with Hydroxyacylglutathione hydrolase n=1 Tax=Bartonella ancashensis TaxID=1318743 RepID=A0A0M5KSF1_9HYPH|nr:SAM-dependent methyltransferase 2, in cluster with Hydroxyacylglutathione hydrolase [Bartonella ancashensis]